jgi:hypothetical protein
MMNDLYLKRNNRKIRCKYPVNGNKNILRMVEGVKAQTGVVLRSKRLTVESDHYLVPKLSPHRVLL